MGPAGEMYLRRRGGIRGNVAEGGVVWGNMPKLKIPGGAPPLEYITKHMGGYLQ